MKNARWAYIWKNEVCIDAFVNDVNVGELVRVWLDGRSSTRRILKITSSTKNHTYAVVDPVPETC